MNVIHIGVERAFAVTSSLIAVVTCIVNVYRLIGICERYAEQSGLPATTQSPVVSGSGVGGRHRMMFVAANHNPAHRRYV